MFQKEFKKDALPARKFSPLMLINSLINYEQIVNNSCSIRVPGNNSCSKQNQFVPKQIKAALMNPFMSILGEKRGRSAPKKNNNFERFFADSTLTFLTFGNTFRLVFLPTRRVIFFAFP